ncbi:MAG: hypothetical protein PHF63_11800 [Herbinix sp.]|nr:hypothetical protein [Herbinix sp.]
MEDFKVSKQSNRRETNVIRVRDARIEEISRDRNTGFVTISYGDMGEFNMIHKRIVTLIVSKDTILQSESGHKLSFRDLEEGMIVDAEISKAMTASIPPQARAYKIVALNENKSYNTKVDRLLMIDPNNNFLITGKANDIYSQIRFNINANTLILDRRGNRMCICDLRPGHTVRIEHANFMTFSIPPQTLAFSVQLV